MTIPLTIAARDEATSIGTCLASVAESIAFAQELGIAIEPLVVLDDCTDHTEQIVHAHGVASIHSSGGKVEAQRRGLRPGECALFLDADVRITPDTLAALVMLLRAKPEVHVASPPLCPLPPRRQTTLARAIHRYNLRRGFSSQRSWFNGRCFAIRHWEVPSRRALAERIAALPTDGFYRFEEGLRVDDVYLSRSTVARHGPMALAETSTGTVYYRAPETLRDMYRYYLRLRRELERESFLFPELEAAHHRFGQREPDLLASASLREKISYVEFQAALVLCRLAYRTDRALQRKFDWRREAWPANNAWNPLDGSDG